MSYLNLYSYNYQWTSSFWLVTLHIWYIIQSKTTEFPLPLLGSTKSWAFSQSIASEKYCLRHRPSKKLYSIGKFGDGQAVIATIFWLIAIFIESISALYKAVFWSRKQAGLKQILLPFSKRISINCRTSLRLNKNDIGW